MLEPAEQQTVPRDFAALRELAAKAAKASGARKVILFGSVARGEAGPDSDLDLLLLLEDDADWLEASVRARVALRPRDWSLDIVPMKLEHFEARRSALAREVAREGVVLYG